MEILLMHNHPKSEEAFVTGLRDHILEAIRESGSRGCPKSELFQPFKESGWDYPKFNKFMSAMVKNGWCTCINDTYFLS